MIWVDKKTSNLNDSQLVLSKKIAVGLRLVKLISEYIVFCVAIIIMSSWLTLINWNLHVFLLIVVVLTTIDYVRKALDVGGFVDDKFRKEISNNRVTSNAK